MRPERLLPLAVLACGSGGPPPAEATSIGLEVVASGLERPVAATAPAGDPRVFVVEQPGRVRVVRGGAALPTPFLDLADRVVTRHNEQGLLGLAFHPAYAANGRLFVAYTREGDGANVVAEVRVSSDPDRADPATLRELLAIPDPYGNHNGGHLAFGPDGFLWIGTGDGGSANDPDGNGQDKSALLGKMLRIDVDSGDPYGIPADNPFVGVEGVRPEIWAYGLRNPWRYSFDRQTGDLYIGDVGQNRYEEVNVQPAASSGGEDYGWNVVEGAHCLRLGCDPAGTVPPVVEYPHAEGCSVTGGIVYRGAAIPALEGVYLYSDYCQPWVRSFRWVDGVATDPRDWTKVLDPRGRLLAGVSSYGEDGAGELLIVNHANGTVVRVVPAPLTP